MLVLGDKWGPEQEKAFACMKALLMLAPVLITVDNNEPLVVGMDASVKGLPAYLAQFRDTKDASGQIKRILHPIAFASRRNSLSEYKEHSFKLKLKGVKWALEEFHKFIWGHQIILKTDCKAVKCCETLNLLRYTVVMLPCCGRSRNRGRIGSVKYMQPVLDRDWIYAS
jgi:RNase H-like domain found in reverse transcriptase